MIELIRFIKDNESFRRKLKKIFKKQKIIKPSDIINQAIFTLIENSKKKSFPQKRERLSLLLREEILKDAQNITPLLLIYSMQEDTLLFHTILIEICTKANKKIMINIFNSLDRDTIIYVMKEIIYLCTINKKMLKIFERSIVEDIFNDLYEQLIGIKPLKECSLEHLDQNLYIIYNVLHPKPKFKDKMIFPSIQTQKWMQRITKDPNKLNQFYISAFEQDYQKQIYSIKNSFLRLEFIKKIRTPELALVAKKKLHLEKLINKTYFI